MTTSPLRVVVAGGGVAGIEALLTLHALAGDRVELTLADARPDFVYRPMKVAEPFARGLARRYPIADMARDAGARLVADAITAVDSEERIAHTAGGEALRYDALLLATGARSVPVYEHALTWDDQSGPDHLGGLLRDIEQGYVRRLAFVVPPGPGWPLPAYELALMTARMAWDAQTRPQITLITPEVAPARHLRAAATAAVRADLEAAGVGFHGASYVEIEKGHAATVVVHPGMRRIEVDRVVALPRLLGRAPSGVPTDEDGFVHVDAHCRVTGARRTSGRPATASPSRSSSAGSPPSRPTRRPRRSRSSPAPTSSRSRSGRCSAAGCSPATASGTCTTWPAVAAATARWPTTPSGGRRARSPAGASRRTWPSATRRSRVGHEPGPAGLAVQTDLARELEAASA